MVGQIELAAVQGASNAVVNRSRISTAVPNDRRNAGDARTNFSAEDAAAETILHRQVWGLGDA